MQGGKLLVLAIVLGVHVKARMYHDIQHQLYDYEDNPNVNTSLSNMLSLPGSEEKENFIEDDYIAAEKRSGGENGKKNSGKSDEPGKKELESKLNEIKILVKAVKDNTDKKAPSMLSTNFDNSLNNIGKITGGVSAMLPGFENLAEGIRKKDKFLIATSALTIASGVAIAVGGPIGMVVAVVLNLAKSLIEIFKPRKEVESQEEMLKRVITDALREFRAGDLIGNFNGFTRKSEMISNNLRKVDTWLERNVEDFDDVDKKDFVNKDLARIAMLKTNFADETLPLAKQFMYEGVDTLGKIKYEINVICDITQKAVPKEEETEGKIEEQARKCLKMLELYSQMSFQRRFCFLSQLSTTLQKIIDTKDVKDTIQAKASAILLLIANNLKVTEKQDIEVLKFLADPLYNYKRRFVINYYNSYKHQYNYLTIYWTSLQITTKESLFVCSQEYLMGNCQSLSFQNNGMFNFQEKTFKPKSLTIPEGFKVQVEYEKDQVTVYGPSTISALKYENDKEEVKNLKISKIQEREKNLPRLSLCRLTTNTEKKKEYKKETETPLHKSVCRNILIDKVGSIDFLPAKRNKGKADVSMKWLKSYKSLDIPSGVAVVAYGKHDGKKFFWGPYYGPAVIEKGAGSMAWSKIKAVDVTEPDALTKLDFHKFLNPICEIQPQNELCNLKDIDSSTPLLKICKENGYCDSIPLLFNGHTKKIINLDYIHVTVEEKDKIINPTDLRMEKGFFFSKKFKFDLGSGIKLSFKIPYDDSIWKPDIDENVPTNILQKLDIPDKVKVELWSKQNAEGTMYGMYVGPTFIEQIDGNIDKESLINSIKIVKVQD